MTKARDNATQGGLVLVSTTSLSGASNCVLTNLLPNRRYRLVLNLYGSSNGAYVYLRFREGSTDKASGYYGGYGYAQYNNNSGSLFPLNNGSQITFCRLTTTVDTNAIFSTDIMINSTQNQGLIIGNGYSYYESFANYFGYHNDSMTDCNGVNIYPSTGTISGTVSLYIYKE